jgi:ATP-binding cassette subfamily C protein CydD
MADPLLSSGRVSAPTVEAKHHLGQALEPGRLRLTASGVVMTLGAAATAAAFFAVAAVAQDVLEQRAGWGRDSTWLLVLASAAVIRAGASLAATLLAVDGALMVETQLRARLLDRLVGGDGASLPSAAQATAVIDEAERVGTYAERYQPARVAAVLVPLVLLAAVFPFSWVVGVLLVLCAPLPPLNLSIVGMGTAAFISAAVLEAIVTIAVAVVAIYVGLTLLGYVHVPGLPSHMSLRTGLFVLMVTPLYFQPVRALAAAYHERADALAAIEALEPLLAGDARRHDSGGERSLTAAPAIEVTGLSVVFPGRELPALDSVSLVVEPGELIGVTGASGAGKSTLLRVLAGDVTPTAGAVLIDGDAASGLERRAITWLGQRPYLFSGTLAENIALARSDADDAEVLDAALSAGLGPVLARLPRGLETPVGESGWGLSGGEAQRVALARTFLKRARLVLLDEPTAHLDSASELAIVEVIRSLAHEATTIVASHSPALLAACDRVVAFDRGLLVDTRGRALVGEMA